MNFVKLRRVFYLSYIVPVPGWGDDNVLRLDYLCLKEVAEIARNEFVQTLEDIAAFQVVMPSGLASTFPGQPGACRYLIKFDWSDVVKTNGIGDHAKVS